MSFSTEEELSALYKDWDPKTLTWSAFGGCSQEVLKKLMNKWFTENPEAQAMLEDIWKRHPCRTNDPVVHDLKIVFKHGKSDFAYLCNKNIRCDSLRDVVMDRWQQFYVEEFHFECNDTVVNSVNFVELVNACKSDKNQLILKVVTDCVEFSSYKKEEEFLKLEKITKAENITFSLDNFDVDVWKSQIGHAVQDIMYKIKLYGPITKVCVSSVREYLSPILSLSALIAEDTSMRAEQSIRGLRGNGPLDYLFLYRKFPVTVTEVKKEAIEEGIAQNDAQMIASRQNYKYQLQVHLPDLKENSKKRKYLQLDITSIPSYGIVSSGDHWIFQEYDERTQTISKSKPFCIDLISEDSAEIEKKMLVVVRHMVAILKAQKGFVDSHQVAKKLRNEI